MENVQIKMNLDYKEVLTEEKKIERKKTTIVDKVVYLLFNSEDKVVHLKDLYRTLKSHSEASVRGNINRYLKNAKENSLIKRVEVVDENGKKMKGYYTLTEVVSLKKDEVTGELLISYAISYKSEDKEMTVFYKDYRMQSSDGFNDGVYKKETVFKDEEDMNVAIDELSGIVINDDAISVLRKIKDNSFDLCITDPPYRCISGGKPKKKGQPSGMLSKNDGKIFDHNNISFESWLPEVYRVLKEGTHAYIFTNFLNLENLMSSARKAGFDIHNLLVWEKNNSVVNGWYMKNAEYVLLLRKGKAKRIKNAGSKTVHKFANLIGNKIHPTEKPEDLLSMYVLNSSEEGDCVLDPFGGSFSLARAALKNMRKFFSIELDKDFYSKGIESIKAVL